MGPCRTVEVRIEWGLSYFHESHQNLDLPGAARIVKKCDYQVREVAGAGNDHYDGGAAAETTLEGERSVRDDEPAGATPACTDERCPAASFLSDLGCFARRNHLAPPAPATEHRAVKHNGEEIAQLSEYISSNANIKRTKKPKNR